MPERIYVNEKTLKLEKKRRKKSPRVFARGPDGKAGNQLISVSHLIVVSLLMVRVMLVELSEVREPLINHLFR